MPAPTAETIIGAVAEKGKSITATPDRVLVAKAWKDTLKSEGAQTAVERIAAKKAVIDAKAARKTINENIGKAEINKVTGDKSRDATEDKRFKDANEAEDRILKFLKEGKGLNGLTDVADQKKVIDRVRAKMDEWDKIGDFFSGKTPAEQAALVQEWAEDPAFFNKVKDLHDKRVVNPAEKIASNLKEKQEVIENVSNELLNLSQTHAEVLSGLGVEEMSYNDKWTEKVDSSGIKIEGASLKDLNELKKQKALVDGSNPTYVQEREAEVADLSTRITDLKNREAALASPPKGTVNTAALSDATKAYNDALDKRSKLNGEVIAYKTRETRIFQYENEKVDLEGKIQGLKIRDEEIQNQYTEKSKERDEAIAERDVISVGREAAEVAFVKSLKSIYADALDELWTEQVKTLEDATFAAYQAEIDDPNTNPDRAALLKALQARYQKIDQGHGRLHTGIGKGEIKTVTDKDKINKDLDILKNNSNPEENLVRRALEGAINPETKKAYEPHEIDAIIAGNPDFVKNNIGDVTAALVAKGLQTKQVSAKDINTFIGRGFVSEAKMIEIVSENQRVKDNLAKAGISKDAIHLLKKNQKFAWWMALLFMFPLAGIAVGSFVAGKHILAKESHHVPKVKKEEDKEEKEEKPEAPEPKVEVDPALLTPEAEVA